MLHILHIFYSSYFSTQTTSNIYWEYTDWNWLNIKRYFHYGPIVKMNKVTDIMLGHFWGDWMNVKISSEFCHLYKCEFEKNLTQLWLRIVTYTRDRNVLSMWFLAGNQGNHQNFDPFLLTNKLWLVSIKMKQKNFFFALFPWKLVKVYWLARMAQNFDQAKRDNTFWPTPNILGGSVHVSK